VPRQEALEVMWTALLLLCSVDGSCFAFGGPALPDERQCTLSIPSGIEYANQTFPQLRVVSYQCVQWGKGV
jgi:hypothetical protein